MGKLQPNFSWQKYEGKPEDQKEQFQFQLQTQHIMVANALNTTIDDLSYFTRERQTGFSWVDNRPIWTKTLISTVASSPIDHGITGIKKVIELTGSAQNGDPLAGFAVPLPYLDTTTLANGISLAMDLTKIYLTNPGGTLGAFVCSVTIYYTKI
jgi:hypothetical protein